MFDKKGWAAMAIQYCASCGTSLMPTMRMCPQCGGKAMSPTPPQLTSVPASTTAVAGVQLGQNSVGTAVPRQGVSRFEPAGHWRRLAAALLDSLILGCIGGTLFGVASLLDSSMVGLKLVPVLGMLFYVALPYIYYTALHSGFRRASWGKAALGLVVVTVQGEQLTKLQAFIRVLLQSLLPFAGYVMVAIIFGSAFSVASEDLKMTMAIAISIGFLAITFGPYLTVYFNSQHQTLFDQICKTCVIRKPNP